MEAWLKNCRCAMKIEKILNVKRKRHSLTNLRIRLNNTILIILYNMSVIEKEIEVVGSKGREKVMAVFDSGDTYSCIHPELAKKLEVILPLPEPMEFDTAKKGTKLRATEAIRLNFYIDGYRFSDEFMLISDFSERIVIGAATLQKWRMKLNFETGEVVIDPRVTKLRLI
jgi:predicted aspartyl protease